MTEFKVALNIIRETHQQFQVLLKAHDSSTALVPRCEQQNYRLLKQIAAKTELPFVSKFDRVDYETRQHWKSYWVLSPLLGKKQLREGKPDVAIAITKIKNHRPDFSLLLVPKKDLLYITINRSAYKIENFNSSSSLDLNELLIEAHLLQKPIEGFFFNIMKHKNQMNAKSETYLDHFKAYKNGAIKVVIDESPLNLIGIAEGIYDFHAHIKSVNEWDIAPFDALITASGNRITQKDGILPLRYNSKTLKFSSFIAKNNFDTDSVNLNA